MTRALPLSVVELVDMAGSAAMIGLAVLCVHRALVLRRKDPQNIIWTYLVWFCSGLLVFSLSRSLGHLVKHTLVAADLRPVWNRIRPWSGSLNTITFVMVGSITLFFSRVYRTYQRMLQDKAALEEAHGEITQLNTNLEKMVQSRTRELAASEMKYRKIFENSKDMLFICDSTGAILDLNPYGVELLGFRKREDSVGCNFFHDFFIEPAVAEEVRNKLKLNGFIKDLELRLRVGKDHERTVLFSGVTTRREGEPPAGCEGIVKDITSRKQMEVQLLQADKLASLSQLSAGLAHEINNPLGLVIGYTRLILKEADSEAQFFKDLQVVEKHALNCKRIVENLLRFSRATCTTKRPVDLNELIREMIAVVENKFTFEKVELVSRLTPDLPPTMADPDKIGQVFMNILMNARQAIEGSGVIAVSSVWDTETRLIQISFQDSGCGIPPEILQKIFDPFFTTKSIGMGTGLGLAVSYGIIKDHSGEIRAESTPGEGSRFIVDLPILEPPEAKTGLETNLE
jgi:two-component system, NtrC family, sensor kinase